MSSGEKKTEGVRFDWGDEFHAALKRIAQAEGFDGHNALARQVVEDYVRRKCHAAKVILGVRDDLGISRSDPEFPGGGRR